MIVMPETVLGAIQMHGRDAYPEECCGGLLGVLSEGRGVRVVRAEPIANASRELRERRYAVDPRDYLRLERRAEELRLSLVGFYHSHPDHPAAPSEHDREHALPFLHYVIVAVERGGPKEATSWIFSEELGKFEREELVMEAEGSGR